MKVIALSDLHGHLPAIPACDLLIVAGDVCPVNDHTVDRQVRWLRGPFSDWLNSAPAELAFGIAGNHDFALRETEVGLDLPWLYLCDNGMDYCGLKVYGSPWTPTFGSWAFMEDDAKLAERSTACGPGRGHCGTGYCN
jgi:hypothetical protein